VAVRESSRITRCNIYQYAAGKGIIILCYKKRSSDLQDFRKSVDDVVRAGGCEVVAVGISPSDAAGGCSGSAAHLNIKWHIPYDESISMSEMQHIHSLQNGIRIWLRLLDFSGTQHKGE
jgi:hypothetical protein